MHRRHFLQKTTLATAATVTGAITASSSTAAEAATPTHPMYSIFTKHFIGLDYERLADAVLATGATGLEAPIRAGGHVEPERVEEDLPKLVEVLKQRGLTITILTSGITEVSDAQHTEKVLRTAKALGIPQYRMAYYRYDLKKPIWEQLQSWKPVLADLVKLSSEIGIQPLYQNHSGPSFCGAGIWDIYSLIREYPAKDIGLAFDIMHAMVEGSESWPLEFALVKDQMGAAFFKNFQWNGRDRHLYTTLAEGIVGPAYIKTLKAAKWSGPISLHVEYLKGSVKDKGYLESAIASSKADMDTLKQWWSAA